MEPAIKNAPPAAEAGDNVPPDDRRALVVKCPWLQEGSQPAREDGECLLGQGVQEQVRPVPAVRGATVGGKQ